MTFALRETPLLYNVHGFEKRCHRDVITFAKPESKNMSDVGSTVGRKASIRNSFWMG